MWADRLVQYRQESVGVHSSRWHWDVPWGPKLIRLRWEPSMLCYFFETFLILQTNWREVRSASGRFMVVGSGSMYQQTRTKARTLLRRQLHATSTHNNIRGFPASFHHVLIRGQQQEGLHPLDLCFCSLHGVKFVHNFFTQNGFLSYNSMDTTLPMSMYQLTTPNVVKYLSKIQCQSAPDEVPIAWLKWKQTGLYFVNPTRDLWLWNVILHSAQNVSPCASHGLLMAGTWVKFQIESTQARTHARIPKTKEAKSKTKNRNAGTKSTKHKVKGAHQEGMQARTQDLGQRTPDPNPNFNPGNPNWNITPKTPPLYFFDEKHIFFVILLVRGSGSPGAESTSGGGKKYRKRSMQEVFTSWHLRHKPVIDNILLVTYNI